MGAVDHLDLTVQPGETLGLLGPNGAGKTTTIRLLNTLLPLQEGTIHLFGLDVHRQAMAVRRLLGYVPQQRSIEGALTGRENVAWFARLFDVPRRERGARVAEVLEMVDSRTCSATTPVSGSTRTETRREACAMSATPPAPPAEWVEPKTDHDPRFLARQLTSRIGTFCLVEMQKLRHDRSELFTRMIQPVLWLVIFGETFNRVHAIPTGSVPYLDYLAPGIIAQSALFVSIFYGIQIIWERDAGVLAKLLVTPTPRVALVAGKAFAAGPRQPAHLRGGRPARTAHRPTNLWPDFGVLIGTAVLGIWVAASLLGRLAR